MQEEVWSFVVAVVLMLVIIISIISMTTSQVLNRFTNLTFSHNNNSVDL